MTTMAFGLGKPSPGQKSFFGIMVLTVSLQIWGLLLKERICSSTEQILSFKGGLNEEGDGLRLPHEKVHLFPF